MTANLTRIRPRRGKPATDIMVFAACEARASKLALCGLHGYAVPQFEVGLKC